MQSWIIGSGADCDVVVGSPLASGKHCELTQTPAGYILSDLGSTNGTYVNGMRIEAPTPLTAGDSITLGRTVPMPWPQDLTTIVRIGRVADNDVLLDDPRVSAHHARLIVVSGLHTLIQDLGSSNGTFVNSADRKVTAPTPIDATNILLFGTLAVPAARLLAGFSQCATVVSQPPDVPAFFEPKKPTVARSPVIATPKKIAGLLAWSSQAPVLAILIALILGRQAAVPATAANWASIGQGIAATTFAVALAAIWLGGSLAIGELVVRGSSTPHCPNADWASFLVPFCRRLAVRAALCVAGCTILLAIVYRGSDFNGPFPAMWGMLMMASLSGLLLGMIVTALVPNRSVAATVLAGLFLLMVVFGGYLWPLRELESSLQFAPAAMPSRWAFEGLFLLETPQHPAPEETDATDMAGTSDLVEDFFRAATERMGTQADATALALMLVGLTALTAVTRRLAPQGR